MHKMQLCMDCLTLVASCISLTSSNVTAPLWCMLHQHSITPAISFVLYCQTPLNPQSYICCIVCWPLLLANTSSGKLQKDNSMFMMQCCASQDPHNSCQCHVCWPLFVPSHVEVQKTQNILMMHCCASQDHYDSSHKPMPRGPIFSKP